MHRNESAFCIMHTELKGDQRSKWKLGNWKVGDGLKCPFFTPLTLICNMFLDLKTSICWKVSGGD